MKKLLFLIITVTIFALAGCSNRYKMVDFIPTPTPQAGIPTDTTDTGTKDTGTDAGSKDGTSNTPADTIDMSKTTTKYVKMTAYDDTLNVRTTPSTDGEKVGFLVHTEKVQVIEIKDGWASIVYEGKVCYVKADYLVDERPAYIEPPTPEPKKTPTPTPDPNATAPEI